MATYSPFLPEARQDPYPLYRAVREAEPVQFFTKGGLWFLTRHADCLALLRGDAFSAALGQRARRRDEPLPPSMLTVDPPAHERLRGPFRRLFAPATVDAITRRAREFVDELLDDIAGDGEADLLNAVADPLPLMLLADLLALPDGLAARFSNVTRAAGSTLDPLASPAAAQRGDAAADAVVECVAAALDAVPGPGRLASLHALAGAAEHERGLSREEVLSACALLVIGGHEPMANLIANGLLALLRDERARAQMRSAPAPQLPRAAVEELLRFDSPIQFAARVATRDVELGGAQIGAGQPVVALIGAANRDPAVFAEPDRLDLERRPNPHLAFGAGAHVCLGAPLARIGAAVAIAAVLRRFPRLELVEEPVWRSSHVPRGVRALRVRW